MARRVAERLGEDERKHPPVLLYGPDYLLMVGDHHTQGWCWCQPRVERVPCTNLQARDHTEHFVFVHGDPSVRPN